MPFYDLKCNGCSEEFNMKASMEEKEKKLINCPNCGSNKLSSVFKNINIIQSKKPVTGECPNINKCGGCCNQR